MARRLTHLIGLLILAATVRSPVALAQGGGGRAALVVRYPDGRVETACVSFNEPSITGEQLLDLAQLTVTSDYSSGMGSAVCSINGVGCAYPIEDCFCQCQGLQCEYWAYYHWLDGAWQYSSVGVTSYRVTDGALEGFSWGPGDFVSGTAPPQIAFDEICRPATATPTATSSPAPSPTATARTAPTAMSEVSPAPPQVFLTADVTTLDLGTCAVLKWVTWDATQVTLNGAPVMAQDRQEVCPTTSQRYLLVAANAGGQTQREITLSVIEPTAIPTPAVMATEAPIAHGAESVAPNLSADVHQLASATPPTSPTAMPPTEPPAARAQETAPTSIPPTTPLPGATPSHAAAQRSRLGLVAIAQAQALPAPSPTAEKPPIPTAPLLPTVVPLPVLSEQVQPNGEAGSTPTPILVAFVGGSNLSASPDSAGGAPFAAQPDDTAASATSPDRQFTPALLPGYAAFLLMAASLLGAGVIVVQRREMLLGRD